MKLRLENAVAMDLSACLCFACTYLLYVEVCYTMVYMSGLENNFLQFSIYCLGPGNLIQVIMLVQQIPLPTKPSFSVNSFSVFMAINNGLTFFSILFLLHFIIDCFHFQLFQVFF